MIKMTSLFAISGRHCIEPTVVVHLYLNVFMAMQLVFFVLEVSLLPQDFLQQSTKFCYCCNVEQNLCLTFSSVAALVKLHTIIKAHLTVRAKNDETDTLLSYCQW